VAPTPVVVPVAALEAPLNPVSRGRAGDDTLALQNRLLELGYWLDGADSRYGEVTFQAVMAFQKQNGLKPTGTADQATVDAMSAATERVSGAAVRDEIEIDVTKQVLYIVRGGLTLWALNTSTGSGKPYVEDDQKHPGEQVTGDARTHIGEFKVSREQAEGWWQSPLGLLYRPKYFDGGIAVHGARNVPNYPASHGCVRVSMAAMDFIWAQNLMPKGLKVWVHA
jgi:peptidoglycan hydrolase-like protein with peptidoglycan-binding domain